MNSLLTDDGILVETQDEILKETTNFYKLLYTLEKTDDWAQDYLLNNLKQTLTDEDKDSMESEITLNEILIAIKSLANEKSPGCDGLTAEFYKTFSNVIGNDLVEVINNGFQKGELSITMRRGVIVLIPKGGEILISRLRDIVQTIIHPNQKCGIKKGRSIHDGASLIRDLIDYVNYKNAPGLIISLDQTKPYDRVEWNFLFKVLEKNNFGPNFINMINLLY